MITFHTPEQLAVLDSEFDTWRAENPDVVAKYSDDPFLLRLLWAFSRPIEP